MTESLNCEEFLYKKPDGFKIYSEFFKYSSNIPLPSAFLKKIQLKKECFQKLLSQFRSQ